MGQRFFKAYWSVKREFLKTVIALHSRIISALTMASPWRCHDNRALSGAHRDFDKMYDIYCSYILNKGTKQRTGKIWWVFSETGKSVSAGWGWKELCLLFLSEKHAWRTEAYSKNPQTHLYRKKNRYIGSGWKDFQYFAKSNKNDGEMLWDILRDQGKHSQLCVLSCALQPHPTVLSPRTCRFPSQGRLWGWVAERTPSTFLLSPTLPGWPSLVMACAEADLPIR